ncbi:acyltransferase family protein [Actinomycetospora atypica]|uniref:Acyltransferase family protein n=1 Tax=Actinomycetospora atypica TaxID=1290095 RepID=A0ABV9YJM2_9PSEU
MTVAGETSQASSAPAARRDTARPSPPRRLIEVDVARALVVVGVVFNHAVDGLVTSGVVDPASELASANAVLYMFRMPALAFLLGLFVPGGVDRYGTRTYLWQRLVAVGYLYLLWFYLQGLVEFFASGVKNHVFPSARFLSPWTSYGQLWFLPFLAVATVTLVAFRPWQSGRRTVVVLIATGAVSLALWGWNMEVLGLHGLSLLVFAAAGAAIGLGRMTVLVEGRSCCWALLGVGAVLGLLVLVNLGAAPATSGSVATSLPAASVSFVAAVCGILLVIALSVLIVRMAPFSRRFFSAIGTNTLPIFLAHVAVVAGVRIAMGQIGVTPGWTVALAVVCGVGGPVVASRFAIGRPTVQWLFVPPAQVRRWLAA